MNPGIFSPRQILDISDTQLVKINKMLDALDKYCQTMPELVEEIRKEAVEWNYSQEECVYVGICLGYYLLTNDQIHKTKTELYD